MKNLILVALVLVPAAHADDVYNNLIAAYTAIGLHQDAAENRNAAEQFTRKQARDMLNLLPTNRVPADAIPAICNGAINPLLVREMMNVTWAKADYDTAPFGEAMGLYLYQICNAVETQ